MKISRRWLLVLLPLVVTASGCTTWGQRPMPEASASARLPSPVRVTRSDESVLVMRDAVVSGDSIVGHVGRDRTRTAVAMADVRSMQARRTDVMATVGLAAAITLAVATTAISYTLGSRLGN